MLRIAVFLVFAIIPCQLACAGEERIGQWQVIEGFPEFAEPIIAIDKDGSATWGAEADGDILRQNLKGLELIGKVTGKVRLIAGSEDGEGVLVATKEGEVFVLNAKDGLPTKLEGTLTEGAIAMGFNSLDKPIILTESGEIVSGDSNGALRQITTELRHPLALLPSSEFVAGVTKDGAIAIKTTTDARLVATLKTRVQSPSAIGTSTDGRFIAISDNDSQRIEVWDLAAQRLRKTTAVPGDPKVKVSISGDCEVIVSVTASGKAYFTDIETSETIERDTSLSPDASDIVKNLSVCGSGVSTISADGKANEWEVAYPAESRLDRQYVTVPVFYATNRGIGTPPRLATEFFKFLFSLPGICLAGISILFVSIAAIRRSIRVGLLGCLLIVLLLAGGWLSFEVAMKDFDPANRNRYGAERSALSYGQCEVTVPFRRNVGELNSPFSLWIYREAADPAAHIILAKTTEMSRDKFYQSLAAQSRSAAGEGDAKWRPDGLVFIHGYNVSFEDAIRRTAQLAADLGFLGPAVCFSWPSHGERLAYTWDSTMAERSIPDLRTVLDELDSAGLNRMHIVAHSMGNRVLAGALNNSTIKRESSAFREIVLAAPDIDANVFVQQVSPVLSQLPQRVTLYASSLDRALASSKVVNGQRRAGDSDPEITICGKIDSIDASAVDTSLMGHSYFADERSVVEDMYYLLGEGFPPTHRFGLRRAKLRGKAYWRIQP